MAFETFFAAERVSLLRFCWGLTLDRDRARDVAQESMTRAFKVWGQVGLSNPNAWVRTVALNIVRSDWRSAQRRDSALRRLGSQQRSTELIDDPIATSVLEALAKLSERQREAVVLHHMTDLSVLDVAEAMGIGVPSVKTHLQRGRAALAGLLENLEEPTIKGEHRGRPTE